MAERSPGESLYYRWCGSTETNQAGYWRMMNRSVQEQWERLARDLLARPFALSRPPYGDSNA